MPGGVPMSCAVGFYSGGIERLGRGRYANGESPLYPALGMSVG